MKTIYVISNKSIRSDNLYYKDHLYSFVVAGNIEEEAKEKLQSLKLNMDTVNIAKCHPGDKLFESWSKEEDFDVEAGKNTEATEFLHKMMEVASNWDTEDAHSTADELLCETLVKINPEFKYGVDIFKTMGKWYA